MLLIDSNYFYHCSKQIGSIDISKLVEYFNASGYKDSIKYRVWVTVDNENPKIKAFQHWLKSFNGPRFEVAVKGHKIKHFACEKCGATNNQLMERNVDLEIATRILEFSLDSDYNKDKTLVLVSGDGDFRDQVKIAKKKGKQIIIVGIMSNISTDLQYLADDIIELDKIKGLEK